MPIQFDIEQLFDGVPSDQLLETIEQVNRRLLTGTMNVEEAKGLIQQARVYEILARYVGFPLENGSAQTLEVELARTSLCHQAEK